MGNLPPTPAPDPILPGDPATLFSLEAHPPVPERARERRWAWAAAWAMGIVLIMAVLAVAHLAQSSPPPALAASQGPLPATVRARAQAVLDQYLLDARLEERHTGPLRDFHISGRTRAPLAQEFYAGFRPAVAGTLMPLLRPYGEIISFDIASLELPPARLRPLDFPKD
jgi:hypothetical protein